MSDEEMISGFHEMKLASQRRRKSNRERSPEILRNRGIGFEEKNGGVHLIVQGKNGIIDFWPGTGKFIARGKGLRGRGVFNLVKLCK